MLRFLHHMCVIRVRVRTAHVALKFSARLGGQPFQVCRNVSLNFFILRVLSESDVVGNRTRTHLDGTFSIIRAQLHVSTQAHSDISNANITNLEIQRRNG